MDPIIIADIEKNWVHCDDLPQREIVKIDLDFLSSPLKIAEKYGVSYPADKLKQLIQRSNQHNYPLGHANYAAASYQHQPTSIATDLSTIRYTIYKYYYYHPLPLLPF